MSGPRAGSNLEVPPNPILQVEPVKTGPTTRIEAERVKKSPQFVGPPSPEVGPPVVGPPSPQDREKAEAATIKTDIPVDRWKSPLRGYFDSPYENTLSGFGEQIALKGSQFQYFAQDRYRQGDLGYTAMAGAGVVSMGFAKGAYDTFTFLVRPKAWVQTGSMIKNIFTDPFGTFSAAGSQALENPLFTAGYVTGSLAGGYAMGKVANRITRGEASTDLPTRQATIKRQLKYEDQGKPYGYQWSIRREKIPVVKEDFSLGKYQVQEAGYGSWPESGAGGMGKIKGYAQTGHDLIPLYDTQDLLGSDLQDVYIPYKKALYGYSPRITPAAYGIREITSTIPGIGVTPGLALGTLNLLRIGNLNKIEPGILRPTPITSRTRLKLDQTQIQKTINDQSSRQDDVAKAIVIQTNRHPEPTKTMEKQKIKLTTANKTIDNFKFPPPDKFKWPPPEEPRKRKQPGPPIFGKTSFKAPKLGKRGREAWMGRIFPVTSPEELLGFSRPKRPRRRR